MDHVHGNAYTNPHWKGDYSFIKDPDFPGSFRIPARALNIIWGNDPRYWQWMNPTEEETRFKGFEGAKAEVAVLLQVNWLEVKGTMDLSLLKDTRKTAYTIHYMIKFRVDAFGWHSAPVKFKVRVNGEETEDSMTVEPYRVKHDVWQEVHGGQFTISNNTDVGNGSVEFGMFEVESDWWKGGMVLGGVLIKPKLQIEQ
ncbi:hypothetical protein F0562_019513 [Nyssa sinensis]|uniref:Uncharacterized protein n=1 Tax=Nyssa sinensis TaxID=561372 RepID=A0A5J5BNQ9_9ASTE|nr:hypothetical protein F0562_019513 [Nyssa sinensis]